MSGILDEAHRLRIDCRFVEAHHAYEVALAEASGARSRESAEASGARSRESAEIKKWLGVVAYQLGDIELSRSRFEDARVALGNLKEQSPSAQLDTELAHCHFNRGQLEYATGHFAKSMIDYDVAIALYEPQSRDWRECALEKAVLLIRMPRRAEEANELIAEVERRQSIGAVVPEEQARLNRVKAEATLSAGDWLQAREILGPAGPALEFADTPMQRVAAVDLLILMGRVELAAGDLGAAQGLTERALAQLNLLVGGGGYHSLQVSTRLDLAVLALARGEANEASAVLLKLDDKLRDPDRTLENARRLDALGSAFQSTGDLKLAADRHLQAIALYEGAESSDFQATICQVNLACDHLLTGKARYVARAARLLRECEALLVASDRDGRELARCRTNLGVALALLGQLGDAEVSFVSAIADYARSGLWLEQSIPRHNHGVLLVHAASAASAPAERDRLLARALEDLITAYIVRDSARFDFTLSHHRRAWWSSQSAKTLSLALRAAVRGNNDELVAELVTAGRLSSWLTTSGVSRRVTESLIAELDVAGTVGPRWSNEFDGSRPHDLNLVLVPGPHVVMPSGRLALARYFSMIVNEQTMAARTTRTAFAIGIV